MRRLGRVCAFVGILGLLAACGSPRIAGSAATGVPPVSEAPATAGRASTTIAESTSVSPPSSSTPSTTVGCVDESSVNTWSLARRAAMLIVAPDLDFSPAVLAVARSAGVGGVLFLGGAGAPGNLASVIADQLDGGTNPKPLAMADEEGGGVQRLGGAVINLPWPRTMAATMSPAEVQGQAATLGSQMLALGVDVDLAPVLDVDGRPGPSSTNPDGLRSFSADPAVASAYGVAFTKGLQGGGVLSVVKHFPGLGGSTGNTDYAPAATLPWAQLRIEGLPPFRAAIAAGARAVMVSNAYVPGLTTLPASISSAVIDGVLRSQLGFGGLVVTDSLSAGAIASAGFSVPAAAVAAIEAGADMILFGSTLDSAQTALLSPANVSSSITGIVAALRAAAESGALAQPRDRPSRARSAPGVRRRRLSLSLGLTRIP